MKLTAYVNCRDDNARVTMEQMLDQAGWGVVAATDPLDERVRIILAPYTSNAAIVARGAPEHGAQVWIVGDALPGVEATRFNSVAELIEHARKMAKEAANGKE